MLVCSTRQTMWSPWRIPWGCVGIGSKLSIQFGSRQEFRGNGSATGKSNFWSVKDEEVYTGDVPTSDNSVTIAGAS